MNKLLPLIAAIGFSAAQTGHAAETATSGKTPECGEARQFMDCVAETPIVGGALRRDEWGEGNVQPRDVANGLESPIAADGSTWAHWDGAVMKGERGVDKHKYYLFAARWRQGGETGHGGWPESKAVVAWSDDSMFGPYREEREVYPEIHEGYGHNVLPFRLKKGGETRDGKTYRYGIVLGDTFVPTLKGGIFIAETLDGPWTLIGQMKVTETDFQRDVVRDEWGDNFRNFELSNICIMATPEGRYLSCGRNGDFAMADTIFGPWHVVIKNLWEKQSALSGKGDVEDPVIWHANGRYHCIVNTWGCDNAYYLSSPDGINDWRVYPGNAYRSSHDMVRYTDGTRNRWADMERPFVHVEDGEVKAMTLSVCDIIKWGDSGRDRHSSKVIVLPLDNEKFRRFSDGGAPCQVRDREGIEAAEDTTVEAAAPESNFGTRKTLRLSSPDRGEFAANGAGTRFALVKFDVTGVDVADATRATLSVVSYCDTDGRDRIAVCGAASGWTEGTGFRYNDYSARDGGVTWNTRPAMDAGSVGACVARSAKVAAGKRMQVVEIDVTEIVRRSRPDSGGMIAFALAETRGKELFIASREFDKGYGPKLDIRVKGKSTKPVARIAMPGKLDVQLRDFVRLPAAAEPSDAADIRLEFSSSDPSVASVDAQGFVTGCGIGNAVVTAKASNGKSERCEVSVYRGGEEASANIVALEANGENTWNGETKEKAFDGSLDTKWCSNVDLTGGKAELVMELDGTYSIGGWKLASAGVREDGALNTREWRIFTSLDKRKWTLVDSVHDNDRAIYGRMLNRPVGAKYVKLVIDRPSQNGDTFARVHEFAVYEFAEGQCRNVIRPYVSLAGTGNNEGGEGSARLADGELDTKWCFNALGRPAYLTIEWPEEREFRSWQIVNAGIVENPVFNTKSWAIEISADGSHWREVAKVVGSTKTIAAGLLDEPVMTRFVRLRIDEPAQNGDPFVRIHEFSLFE